MAVSRLSLDANSRPDTRKAGIAISNEIVALSHLDREAVLRQLGSSKDGLDGGDAAARLRAMGANSITQEEQPSIVRELLGRAKNPLNGLLLSLAFASYLLGDLRAAIVIGVMVVLATAVSNSANFRLEEPAFRVRIDPVMIMPPYRLAQAAHPASTMRGGCSHCRRALIDPNTMPAAAQRERWAATVDYASRPSQIKNPRPPALGLSQTA